MKKLMVGKFGAVIDDKLVRVLVVDAPNKLSIELISATSIDNAIAALEFEVAHLKCKLLELR